MKFRYFMQCQLFYGLSKTNISFLFLLSPKFSYISLLYCLCKICIPYLCLFYPPSIKHYQHMTAPSTAFKLLLISFNLVLQEHSHRTSTTASISYNHSVSSHLLLAISSIDPQLFVFPRSCRSYPIGMSHIPSSPDRRKIKLILVLHLKK